VPTPDAPLDVLFEDPDFLVVNKPAGLVCHPTKGDERSSLVGRVRLHLGHGDGRLVNRLDRETSGIVLIATSAVAARELGGLFARPGGIDKTYWAIVHGHVSDDRLTIEEPIGRDDTSVVAIKDRVRPDGAAALTRARVQQRFVYHGVPMTWLEVMPATGRKHQIRIHLAHAGHPIVGDKIYGADETRYLRFVAGVMTDADRAALIVANHLLHARSIAFDRRGLHHRFVAEPGAEFGAMLAACQT
jgi:23S rRNA pseudouridine1911/1915/1917 synthase